jgi:thiol:disulfide interchange protein DsbA
MIHRREFSQAAALVAATAAVGAPLCSFAQTRPPDSKEYLTLDKRLNVDAPPGKVEVVDFFWYSCPHCNAFEPTLVKWIAKLPPDVALKRVPVAFRPDMIPQQHLFYTLEAMGRLDLHGKVFETIHRERAPLARDQDMPDWAAKQGLDKVKFQEIYTSFAVAAKARRARQIADDYQLSGVPALGIAGRWYVDGETAKNMPRALEVTDYLIAEARKSR